MENLFSYLPDASSTVVLIVFMILWHKRTMERDKQFNETTRSIVDSLMECMKSRLERED